MAETRGTPPRYKLSDATREAVREAGPKQGEARRLVNQAKALDAAGDAAVQAGLGVATGLAVKEEREKAAKEEREAEEKRIRLLTEEANIKFDEGLASIPARNGWPTPELYDQFLAEEEQFRLDYLDLVEAGDRRGAAKALRDQQTRASELTAIKGSMETAAGVGGSGGEGWSNKVSHNTEMMEDLTLLSKLSPPGDDGEGGVTASYVDNELVMTVTRADGTVKEYRKAEIDKMVADGIAPDALRAKSMEDLDKYKQMGYNKKGTTMPPDWGRVEQDNAKALTNEDIDTFFIDAIYDKNNTFVDDFISDDNIVWQGEPIKINSPDLIKIEAQLEGGNQDGVIDEEEWELILDNDGGAGFDIFQTRRLIANEMRNHPEIARKYIAAWQTGLQQQNFDEGRRAGDEDRKGQGGNSMSIHNSGQR